MFKIKVIAVVFAQLAAFSFAQSPAGNERSAALFRPAPLANPALKVYVLQGDNAANYSKSHVGNSPVVEIRDADNLPVEGATVLFEAPTQGPGGVFGGKSVLIAKTDRQGQAMALFSPNDQPGTFQIRVTASFNGETGTGTIHQRNTLRPVPQEPQARSGGISKKGWIIIGGVAVAAATTAAVLSTRSHSNSTSVSITPGTPVFGGPK